MPWTSKLVIKADNVPVTPIQNFIPTINIPIVPLHSLEADNIGFVAQPATFTFKMDVLATGGSVAALTKLALARTPFTIEETEDGPDNFDFTSIAFNQCLITSMLHTAQPNAAPVVTVSGICLQVVPTSRTP
jgi:hypothetical protein